MFDRRNQKEGEPVDSFVSELKRLSLTCEFGELRDSLIRGRIVGGVLSDELRGELLKKPDLTLQKAHDYCRTFEASELQKFKLNIQASAGTEYLLEFSLLESQRKLKRQVLVPVNFVVTSTHLLDHLVVPHLENSASNVRKKAIFPKYPQGMSRKLRKLI